MDTINSTLQYYQKNAEDFAQGTVSAEMHDTRLRFYRHLPPRGNILDFGCGSGRDSKAFKDMGLNVEASDGSLELCRIAERVAGIPVRHLLFNELDAKEYYDGIWACASILHLPKAELEEVMLRISTALKAGGVLYSSFKYGTFEGIRNGRYFTDFTEETLKEFMAGIPSLQAFDVWITGDVRTGREEERWINMLARRS